MNYLVCRPNLIFCRHNLLHSSLIRINHPQLSQIPTDRPGNLVQKKRNSALLTAPCGIIVPTVTLVAALVGSEHLCHIQTLYISTNGLFKNGTSDFILNPDSSAAGDYYIIILHYYLAHPWSYLILSSRITTTQRNAITYNIARVSTGPRKTTTTYRPTCIPYPHLAKIVPCISDLIMSVFALTPVL